METVRSGDVLVRRGEVTVEVLGGDSGVDEAIGLLDRAEAEVQAPLVDEAERSRLRALADGTGGTADHWHPLLARTDGEPAGYAGIVLAADGVADGVADGDLAPDRRRRSYGPAVTALFAGLSDLGRRHGAGRLRVWVRHATDADESCASSEGFEVERRLAVMGRALDEVPEEDRARDGVRIRAFAVGTDEAAVVDVLREAYEGTPDGGWDRARFDRRRAYDWFDPDDLLVAEDQDGVAGLHWTKRRGDGTGEVYNLAVADRARGTGLGRALLRAGLAHLARRGCDDVILWVDHANTPAVELYRSEGFSERWVDVAFRRDLGRDLV